MNDAELGQLLSECRVRNAALGISGMLLYAGGTFMQALEGNAEVVDRLFAKINADQRHTDVTLIERDEIAARCFSSWAMGFRRIHHAEAEPARHMADFFSTAMSATGARPGTALKLLQQFCKNAN